MAGITQKLIVDFGCPCLFIKWLLIFAFLVIPALAKAQFSYTTDNNTISITGYSGPGGEVLVPQMINGLPVISIGFGAFSGCHNLTTVVIPETITNIGEVAFRFCDNLDAITVDPHDPIYSSMDGVLFDKDRTKLIKCPGGRSGSYIIPDGVATVGDEAFTESTRLTCVVIPNSVKTIEWHSFYSCTILTNIQIGSGVTNIGDDCSWVALGAPSLMSINVATNNPAFSSLNGVLFNKNQSLLIV